MMIRENAAKIMRAVEEAAKKSGRAASDVTVIGVTKTVGAARIRELLAAGIADIGENRVQEFLPKREELGGEVGRFHFIGHLQRNKAKFVVGKADFIHSVDSLALADEIDRRAGQQGITAKILLELNVAGEASKIGARPDDAPRLAEQIFARQNLELVGLMCVPPMVSVPEDNRRHFAALRDILFGMNSRFPDSGQLRHLSMGMSGDFFVAIEEGATMVRIGSGFFGKRAPL